MCGRAFPRRRAKRKARSLSIRQVGRRAVLAWFGFIILAALICHLARFLCRREWRDME